MLWYFTFPIFVFFYVTLIGNKKWAGLVLMIILLFFSMFRGDDVGTDTRNYMDIYDRISNLFLYDANYTFEGGRTELLYYYLCSFIYLNNLSPRIIIYVFSLITFVFLYFGCKKNKINISLFFLFYVLTTSYIISFNVARQFAAISICFYATSFLTENNWKKYLFVVIVLLASLIHTSSILFIVLLISDWIKINRLKVGLFIYLFSLLAIVLPLTDLAFSLFAKFNILERYDQYGASGDFATSENGLLNYVYKTILFTIYYAVYYIRTKDKKTDLWDILFLLFFLVQAVFATEGNLATYRIKFAFMPLMCSYFALVFARKNKNKEILYYSYCLIGYAMCIRVSLGYLPYSLQFN